MKISIVRLRSIIQEELVRLHEAKLKPTMGGEINFRVKLVPTTNPQAKELQRNAMSAITQYYDRGNGEFEFSLKRSDVEDARQRFAKAGIRMQEAGREDDEDDAQTFTQSKTKLTQTPEFDFGDDDSTLELDDDPRKARGMRGVR